MHAHDERDLTEDEWKNGEGRVPISGQDMQLSLSLHRLKQTGVFIYDPTSHSIALPDLEYIVQSANIVFCQNITTQALDPVFRHYRGNKLVLCGGGFSFCDALSLLQFTSTRRHALSLHLSDVTAMSFLATLAICFYLGEPSDAIARLLNTLCSHCRIPMMQWGALHMLKELSVDTSSVGGMGLSILLATLRMNITLETLIIKFSHKSALLPACHAKALRQLMHNNTLRELRIFGCSLGPKEVSALYEAIKGGLRGLVLLEFSATTAAQPISDSIIQLAKDRLYAGRGSLSVSVI